MTGEPGAEAEVDVLEVGEVLLVEQSDVGEQGGAVQARSTARGEHLAGLPDRLGRLIAVAGERQSPHGVEVARAVDRLPVTHQQAAGGDRHVGVGSSRTATSDDSHRGSATASLLNRATAPRPGLEGVADASVHAAGEAEVDVVAQNGQGHRGDLSGERVEQSQRVVVGPVVDDDDLDVVVVLGGERANAGTEVSWLRSSSARRSGSPAPALAPAPPRRGPQRAVDADATPVAA